MKALPTHLQVTHTPREARLPEDTLVSQNHPLRLLSSLIFQRLSHFCSGGPDTLCMRTIVFSNHIFISRCLSFHLGKQELLSLSPPKSPPTRSHLSPVSRKLGKAARIQDAPHRSQGWPQGQEGGTRDREGHEGDSNGVFWRGQPKVAGLTLVSSEMHGCLSYCSLDAPVAC